MYCKNCGVQIAGNDKFCGNCGAPIGHQINRERKEKAFWRHAWFTIFMLFMCFPVGVILVFINHPSVAKTFLMFILGLIVLFIIALSSCSLDVEQPAPRPPESIKGQYVDSGFVGKYPGGKVCGM
ncbi:MAG: zinc-ribbon domain-containing protein [Phascolarctobacterium sp.]|nr:zinc-ribbon domain-containing protein [Phascolarctobacterium sp.]MBR6510753.1 zinc-ribbon domain-containing protein [Phascolarctobacterium sp.]